MKRKRKKKREDIEWNTGEVKFYNEDKGFGFITCYEKDNDFFFHITNVKSEPIEKNDQVIFELTPSRKKEGEYEATNLSHINKFDNGSETLIEKYFEVSSYDLHKDILNSLTTSDALTVIKREIENHSIVSDDKQYKSFRSNIEWFKDHINSTELKAHLEVLVADHLNEVAEEKYLYKAWIEGVYTKELDQTLIQKNFTESNTDERTKIFQKIKQGSKKSLLIKLIEIEGSDVTIEFILHYLNKVNGFGYSETIQEKLFDDEYWQNKQEYELYEFLVNHLNQILDDKQKLDLYLKGYLNSFSEEYVLTNTDILSEEDVKAILDRNGISKKGKNVLLKRVLQNLLQHISDLEGASLPATNSYDLYDKELRGHKASLKWLFKSLKKHSSESNYNKVERDIVENGPQSVYLFLWENGFISVLPSKVISNILATDDNPLLLSSHWINEELTTGDEIKKIIRKNLLSTTILNRSDFYSLHNQLEVLRDYKFNFDSLNDLPQNIFEFVKLSNWLAEDDTAFNFNEFKTKLSFLKPVEQSLFLKKLFKLVHKGHLDITVNELNELVQIDLNDFYNREGNKNEIPFDISTHVVVESIKSFSEKGEFLFDGELLKIVLSDLSFSSTYKVQLAEFFETCEGRLVAEWNWNRSGEIRKEFFTDNKFYYAIEFSPGEAKEVHNNWGGSYTKFFPNPHFQELKEEVKKLPGRKWNPDKKHWGVPAKFEQEVMEFAETNRFYLHDEGSNYKNNVHLAEFTRKNVPRGIKFCEGRKAKEKHNTLGQEFWWCCNEPCFQNCETLHDQEDWQNYTLLDFCEIMNLNLDDTNRVGDLIDKGKYYQFISTINRFNRLLDRLYCESCEQIMYPIEDSHFAYHRVTRFHCKNESCSEHHQEVYLHHCLNGKCNGIIDSRISSKCPNGLYICSNIECGSCCSHSMLSRRYENLQKTGGYVHPNLIQMVENQLGHFERNEYFCYECGNSCEKLDGHHVCNNCNIEFEFIR